MTALKPIKWESISLLFIVSNNSKKDFWVKLLLKNQFHKLRMNLLFPTSKSTGQQKEVFQELKIKALVDLAGHLHQLPHVNLGLCCKRKQSIYHNSNWLTVQVHMEIMDVMVDRDWQL